MRIDPQWLHEFVEIKVADRQLADDLTLAGVAVESVKEIDGRLLFEMEIGTNRPDAMCHYGVARECSAIYDIDLKPIKPKLPKAKPAIKHFPIEIEDPEGCKRYTARVVRNVKIGPSPTAILERLKIDDHGGVSNAVDASNYTLMELGHPTHAFDLDKLQGGKIIVRRARPGEMLTTLDGVERKLDPEDLIIADTVRPVALAGVMGGLETAISESTKNILIESAWFDPVSVRKTARRLGMHTDASHIFERGADWGATPLACDRVAELILQTAGGQLEGEPVDAVAGHVIRHGVWLRRSEVLRHLGQEIPDKTVERILRRLGFKAEPVKAEMPEELRNAGAGEPREKRAAIIQSMVQATGLAAAKVTELMAASKGWGPGWMVALPTWRLDIEREIDLIEEIARIYGYNKFENRLPSFSGGVVELPNADKQARVHSELLALGYNEAVSPTFISPADARAFSSAEPVLLANPLSEEQSAMRTSLLPGMLAMLAWNLNRGTSDVRLFEGGHIFELSGEKSEERRMLSMGATGNAVEPSVHTTARPYSFFDLKGDIETLLASFELSNTYFDGLTPDYFHPGRSARAVVDGVTIAHFGQLHPDIAAARKIKQ
ncbi:MAG TPA: phenylalanine--tRNA ligase subunit beta, partial [Candidatus Angelobacter sp.]|nr:phenylalanine--tRNA ligase subunit beta [Candidatus Angelobacter sp.]